MSLGKDNTIEDVDYVLETFPKIVDKLRNMSPMWKEFEEGVIDSVISPIGPRQIVHRSTPPAVFWQGRALTPFVILSLSKDQFCLLLF